MSTPPDPIHVFHILHVDRLASVVGDGFLWSDAETRQRGSPGTVVGMGQIKDRRLTLPLDSHPGLMVGQCVPFYFCPRSVMLYLLDRGNHERLSYNGGQEPMVHLVARLHPAVEWARTESLRWAFTLSNAGSLYFDDRADLAQIGDIDWDAVAALRWGGRDVPSGVMERKQAEFLVEHRFAWTLFRGVGVQTRKIGDGVTRILSKGEHKPTVRIQPDWYY